MSEKIHMELTLAERVAIVEIKVDTLQQTGESIDAKMGVVYDHIMGEKAKKALIRNALAAIGGFVAFLGTLWALIADFPHK